MPIPRNLLPGALTQAYARQAARPPTRWQMRQHRITDRVVLWTPQHRPERRSTARLSGRTDSLRHGGVAARTPARGQCAEPHGTQHAGDRTARHVAPERGGVQASLSGFIPKFNTQPQVADGWKPKVHPHVAYFLQYIWL